MKWHSCRTGYPEFPYPHTSTVGLHLTRYFLKLIHTTLFHVKLKGMLTCFAGWEGFFSSSFCHMQIENSKFCCFILIYCKFLMLCYILIYFRLVDIWNLTAVGSWKHGYLLWHLTQYIFEHNVGKPRGIKFNLWEGQWFC